MTTQVQATTANHRRAAPAGREVSASSGPAPAPRLFFDLSWSLRWAGPPVGILRVERELARFSLTTSSAIGAFFDPETRSYVALDRSTTARFLSGDAVLDTLGLRDPGRTGKRKSDLIPKPLRGVARWLLQFRHSLLQALERRRLSTQSAGEANLLDRLQRRLMWGKYRAFMLKPDGTRRDFLAADRLGATPIDFRPDDVLVCAGAGWTHTDISSIREQKQAAPFRLVLMCYDIIPLLFPQFYKPHDVAAFERYFGVAFALADVVVFTSRSALTDATAWCAQRRITIRRSAVVPLGADVPDTRATNLERLPAGLIPGRFALFVSTIEPRKGHRLLYETWLRLLADGVPQKTGFKLVFVGRKGWLVDDLVRTLDTDERIAGTLLRLEHADDATVRTLYAGAAFCCYPSLYEGYGLPLVEAFYFGKAVLASTGGALPEVARDFSPCLDPNDPDAWYDMMRLWIEDPEARASYEKRIADSFDHPSWDSAAGEFFARAMESIQETIDRS